MLVLPIARDKIKTKDGHEYRVLEFTPYKDAGPAVYAKKRDSKDSVLVYFFDIDEINGTRVFYKSGPKVFEAAGHVNREEHLPQPDDKISLKKHVYDHQEREAGEIDVTELKLKPRGHQVNSGLLVKDAAGNFYRIKDVVDIKRALGGKKFNRASFVEIYRDYFGV